MNIAEEMSNMCYGLSLGLTSPSALGKVISGKVGQNHYGSDVLPLGYYCKCSACFDICLG